MRTALENTPNRIMWCAREMVEGWITKYGRELTVRTDAMFMTIEVVSTTQKVKIGYMNGPKISGTGEEQKTWVWEIKAIRRHINHDLEELDLEESARWLQTRT